MGIVASPKHCEIPTLSTQHTVQEETVSMNHEELSRYLVRMGLEQDRATRVLESLLQQFTGKGMSDTEAIEEVAADLQSKGKLYQQVLWMVEKETASTMSLSPDEDTYYKSGYSNQTEQPASSAPGKYQTTSPGPSRATDRSHTTPSKRQGFISRHTTLVSIVVVIVLLASAGAAIKSFRKSGYAKVLDSFDQQLKMDTQEQFERSLENMKLLIEYTATQVNKRGWSESEVDHFYQNTGDRYKRFVQSMETAAAGESALYGHDCRTIRQSLCGGMHMVLRSIRDEDHQLIVRLVELSAGPTSYILCDPAAYKPSENMVLERDEKLERNGKKYVKYVLREKTDTEKRMENLFKIPQKNPPQGGATPPRMTKQEDPFAAENKARRKAEDEAFYKAQNDVYRMNAAYFGKHGRRCSDVRELLGWYQAEGKQVAQSTVDFINNGMIGLEQKEDGTGSRVLDLRPAAK
jgi:uncharacterized protein YoaH (UPF0181 family)